MPVKAVIFDIGGVLEVNPRTGWQDRWSERLDMPRRAFEERVGWIWPLGSVGSMSLQEVESQIATTLGLDPATVNRLMEDIWAEYVGSLNHDLARYFKDMRPRFKTGILSNSFVGAREREQAAYGFEDMCDVIAYSHEIGCLKPDAQAYRTVCEQLEVAPAQALFLDDVEANVQGAIEFGLRAVHYRTNQQAIAELETHLSPSGDPPPNGTSGGVGFVVPPVFGTEREGC